jgi:hypothetical protein
MFSLRAVSLVALGSVVLGFAAGWRGAVVRTPPPEFVAPPTLMLYFPAAKDGENRATYPLRLLRPGAAQAGDAPGRHAWYTYLLDADGLTAAIYYADPGARAGQPELHPGTPAALLP